MSRQFNRTREHGAAAVLAMLFLVLVTTLSVAMFSLATTNVQSAQNLSDVARAQAAAEAGVRWMAYRFVHMDRPKTTIGNITPSVANTLWEQTDGLQERILDDLASMTSTSEQAATTTATSILSAPISVEEGGPSFQLFIEQDAGDARFLNVTSTGRFKNTSRSVAMRFQIDKKIKFAVVGKVPIQLGRNTIVEGPVAMATANKFPPLLMLSDFMHFDSTLASTLAAWNTFLQANHNGYDNRISMNNPVEKAAALAAGYTDYNSDGYLDEFDLFLKRFDTDGDKRIHRDTEFTNPSTGKLYEPNLYKAINTANGPMFDGDSPRYGYNDEYIDNYDGYAKLRGYIELATTANAWQANLTPQGKDINDMIQGTVAPTEPGQVPVRFGVDPDQMLDLNPANFEQAAANFKTKTGPAAGTTVNNATQKHNIVLTPGMANGGTVTERTPYGSTAWQATYKRPVFQNMNFKNVQIPKGMNALFKNCTFEGVTWVDGEHDIIDNSGAITYNKDRGMDWAKYKLQGDNFNADKPLIGTNQGNPTSGQTATRGSKNGNNLRFDGCTFNGPLAGNYATAYTHFANSWEFTGATMFNNVADETATILSPQVNIEMGSFTNPANAPSTLIGVVVAGNLDIRGTSNVDGSIIITGDGAGNTTLAYFGASDASTDPNAPMPEGGWGRLNIRYNPNRALPDGINIEIDVLPVSNSYSEEVAWPG